MRKWTLLVAIILASGCGKQIEYRSVPLPMPPELVLPKIPGDALQCLPGDAYEALVKRDRLQTQRRTTLRAIIESTHE